MRAAQEAQVIPPIESSTAVMGPSCTVLVMFRLQGDGRAVRNQYELAGTARRGTAGYCCVLRAAGLPKEEVLRPGRMNSYPASSTAARTSSSVSSAAETTVTSPVAATALTEVTPGRAESSLVTAPSQCPQVMPVTR